MDQEKLIKFMRQALFVAKEFSGDSLTQIGSLILNPEDYTLLAQGANRFPIGVDATRRERHERPMKYSFFEHAERDAIFSVARRYLRGSLVITTTTPDTGCARAIIMAGASEAYFPEAPVATTDYAIVLQMFKEAGVKVGHIRANRVVSGNAAHPEKLNSFILSAEGFRTALAKDPLGSATLFLSPTDYTTLSQGYSGFPRGADDTRTERYYGAERVMWVEGSVRNAIYNVVRPHLKGCLGMVTATTCVECARAFAGVGAKHVVYLEPTADMISRWGRSFETAHAMLAELGIEVTMLSLDAVLNVCAAHSPS